jgi:hypothetical protein
MVIDCPLAVSGQVATAGTPPPEPAAVVLPAAVVAAEVVAPAAVVAAAVVAPLAVVAAAVVAPPAVVAAAVVAPAAVVAAAVVAAALVAALVVAAAVVAAGAEVFVLSPQAANSNVSIDITTAKASTCFNRYCIVSSSLM